MHGQSDFGVRLHVRQFLRFAAFFSWALVIPTNGERWGVNLCIESWHHVVPNLFALGFASPSHRFLRFHPLFGLRDPRAAKHRLDASGGDRHSNRNATR